MISNVALGCNLTVVVQCMLAWTMHCVHPSPTTAQLVDGGLLPSTQMALSQQWPHLAVQRPASAAGQAAAYSASTRPLLSRVPSLPSCPCPWSGHTLLLLSLTAAAVAHCCCCCWCRVVAAACPTLLTWAS